MAVSSDLGHPGGEDAEQTTMMSWWLLFLFFALLRTEPRASCSEEVVEASAPPLSYSPNIPVPNLDRSGPDLVRLCDSMAMDV